jgi:hypothetical protein
MLVLLWMIWRRRNRSKWRSSAHGIQGWQRWWRRDHSLQIKELSATCYYKDFSERLGGGGFGSVFEGVLRRSNNGDDSASVVIAVKRFDDKGVALARERSSSGLR